MDIARFLKAAFFIEHLRWLLLIVLPLYSKVTWGVCFFISPPCAFDFDQKLTQNVAQIILYYQVTKELELIGHVVLISKYVFEIH